MIIHLTHCASKIALKYYSLQASLLWEYMSSSNAKKFKGKFQIAFKGKDSLLTKFIK